MGGNKKIAFILLTVYGLILAHAFIPHHHHGQPRPFVEKFCHYHAHTLQHPSHTVNGSCCNHENTERACSFHDETIVPKFTVSWYLVADAGTTIPAPPELVLSQHTKVRHLSIPDFLQQSPSDRAPPRLIFS